MVPRLVLVIIAASLLAVQVIRNALVAGLAVRRPAQAAEVWSGNPIVERSLAMSEIGAAARAKKAVPSAAKVMVLASAMKEPLAAEPFLVRGVDADLAGLNQVAERAFEAAQWRDPRSLPAAYFLADRFLKDGKVARGLNEIAALARIAPGGNSTIAPYLAAYARDPRNWPALHSLFEANPDLADPALTGLAAMPATAPAVLALADPGANAKDVHWLAPLLDTLVGQQDYAKAHAIWERFSRVQKVSFIYDSEFRDSTSPPPFNWALTGSTIGIAEREKGDRLHVIFYGQEDGILASELLVLPGGSYRMTLQLLGERERAHLLNWSIWCDKADVPLSSITLDKAAEAGWTFRVPANCPAQWLKLSGVSGEVAKQVDVALKSLRLSRTGNGS